MLGCWVWGLPQRLLGSRALVHRATLAQTLVAAKELNLSYHNMDI